MATSHGRKTVITVSTKDISPYCKTSSLERGAAVHNTTGYGVDDELNEGGLRNGKFTCGGVYDNTASVGPANALDPLVGTVCAVVRKVEGTGTGKPLQTFNAVLEKYVETNPHDDMVTWSADFTVSGTVAKTVQP
jgi:hypothetical protein